MLEDEVLCIGREFAEVVLDGLITAVYAGVETRVVHIEPEMFVLGLFGPNLRQLRVFERIGVVGFVERPESVVGQINAEVAVRLGHKPFATTGKAEAADKHYEKVFLQINITLQPLTY